VLRQKIRAFLLERGVAVRQGLRFFRAELPGILARSSDALSPRMVRIVEDLDGDLRRLDERIQDFSNEVEAIARLDAGCERLMYPVSGQSFRARWLRRRHLGSVLQRPRLRRFAGPCLQADLDRRPQYPRQDIEAGNRYLRVSFVQGHRADQVKELAAPQAQVLD
jgi:transposase